MFSGLWDLLLILAPLFIGYLFQVRRVWMHRIVDKLLSFLVYFILFLMGLGLAQVPDLAKKLSTIVGYVVCFVLVINLSNILVLSLYDKKIGPIKQNGAQGQSTSIWRMILSSSQLVLIVLLGFLLGMFVPQKWLPDHHNSTYVLMLLLFFVGVQLRNNGIPLRSALLNKKGTMTACWFMLSSLLGGMIAALILGLPIKQGLAIASGFGWYSLSGIVIQNAFGPVLGSVAFFNDLIREFFALAFIPILMVKRPCAAIGIGGATSLDFTLPVIQRSGGMAVVPIAISFGLIVNICSPILMILFTQ
ncbi:lysine exporter LysO family protein [Neisseria sp. Ec49-e6-T10]|uniref:lysine exporter LysO family protein n=1 Tax=Neisseria sp. Ec49-e6-T10 TaxID=3140744 RepID=UPI003EBE2400